MHMNKKRKILTVVALAVFSVIIFFHYYGPWYDNGNVWHDRMSAAEKATAVNKGYRVTVIPRPKFDPDKSLAQRRKRKNSDSYQTKNFRTRRLAFKNLRLVVGQMSQSREISSTDSRQPKKSQWNVRE
jgi:hypothetical protein